MTIYNKGSMNIIVPQSTLQFNDDGAADDWAYTGIYMNPSSNSTFAFWAKCDLVEYGGTDGFGFGYSDGTSRYYIGIYGAGASDSTIIVGVGNTAHSMARASDYVDTTNWHHWAMTTETTGTGVIRRLYMDGSFVSSATHEAADITIPYSLAIGARMLSNGTRNWYFSGACSEVIFYSGTRLDATEIEKLYNGVITPIPTAHYKFTDREDDTLTDFMGNYDGSISGATGSLSGARWENRTIRCWDTRWDESNYDIVVETFLEPQDRHFLFRNVMPGVIREYSNPLGWVVNLDGTYQSGNTLIFEPISNYGLSSLRQRRIGIVKNISDTFLTKDYYGVKIECKWKRDWSDWD